MKYHSFRHGPLARAIEAIVAAGGSDAREAKLVAENLVLANLLGHDSHGIGMIPRYIAAVLEGGLAPNQHPEISFDGGIIVQASASPSVVPGANGAGVS